MISTVETYRKRGGTMSDIARAWKKTPTAVQKIVNNNHPDMVMVEFNVFNPASVYRCWIKKSIKVKPERVLFDKRSPDEDEVMG